MTRSQRPETSERPDTEAEHSTRPTGSAEALLLQDQVNLIVGGDGAGTDCARDLRTELPAGYQDGPSVWIGKAYGEEDGLVYGRHSALCLHGFSASTPVEVTVSAGSFSATTDVQLSTSPPTFEGYEPPDSLFRGAAITAHEVSPVLHMTEMWMFVATPEARDAVVRAGGRLTLAARQGDRRAVGEQVVLTPVEPARSRVDGTPPGTVELLVTGFEPGTRVPVGLYRRSADYESARRVGTVGTVRMPEARVAEFHAPPDLLDSVPPGDYCLIVPTDRQDGCPSADPGDGTGFTSWPAYPGEGRPGAPAATVRAWQDILIRAGVISDIAENRDGVYGAGMTAAVLRLQKSWGWSDADGIAGPQTYSQLTGLPRPD